MDAGAVRGHLDGLEGSYIVGWAVSQNDAVCEITVTDRHDKLVARGLASVERQDLLNVAEGRCNIAFRIPLPPLPKTDRLHVWADGVEISKSPLRLGSGLFDGHAAINTFYVEGWVSERLPEFEPPLITVLDHDGNLVMSCQSHIEHVAADGKFSPAHFAGELDDMCFGRGEMQLGIFANGVKFASVTCNLPLNGFLEVISPDRCAGWLLCPSAPNRSFGIDVWRNGKLVANGRSEIPRCDVQSAFPSCSQSGFDILLPSSKSQPVGCSTISLRFQGSKHELFEGPYVLGNRQDLVIAARNISRLALSSLSPLLGTAERAVLQRALSDFLVRARKTDALVFNKQAAEGLVTEARTRLNVIIPAYRDTEITRACIESVLRDRLEQEDRLIIIDDCSPEPDMEAMLNGFRATHNVFILRNESNLGFVKTVNRGLKFCNDGDVLLLNSDTRLFPGCLNALWQVAHSASDIGTVTALSNNATIFSYPHISLRSQLLADISWEELAAIALDRNRGKIVDVPTGHGFCLLIRRDVLRRVGELDEIFGRGYGEENDLCARAADLGYRNVAACAAIVEHVEGVSFANDKTHLLSANVKILETRYPEYSPIIMEAERCDDLRIGRWALDAARLERLSRAGERFALVVCHDLGGGTNKAIADIEETVGYGNANKITLRCRNDGYIELKSERPAISALFAAEEIADLLQVLSGADIGLVVVHQVLGFSADFINGMADWIKGRRSVFYAHDFYPLCPRVTMIDAVERFCDLAPTDVCKRCLALSGAHSSSRLDDFSADQHRAMFGAFLSSFSHVVAPSQNAAHYYRAVFPQLSLDVISHPAPPLKFPAHPRAGTDDEIVLFGAIGPHKGSADLLELVHLARLTTPSLRFRVIGYTNRDDELRKAGNVSITGAYKPADLPTLASRAKGRLALFLPGWPETFSYTLTEAVQLGFIPLVPDIGAPAERVMAAGLGAVFEFPIVPSRVLALIADIASGKRKLMKKQATPSAYSPDPQSVAKTKAMFGV